MCFVIGSILKSRGDNNNNKNISSHHVNAPGKPMNFSAEPMNETHNPLPPSYSSNVTGEIHEPLNADQSQLIY